MRKEYRSSNVRFCMDDENQRRTWEYLQSITRKEGSYGKILSDAFVQILHYKEYYLARAKNKGTKIYYDKLINSILDKFENGIPKKLNDRDRSFFFVGLAQQKTALFSAKNVSDSDTEETAGDADTAIA